MSIRIKAPNCQKGDLVPLLPAGGEIGAMGRHCLAQAWEIPDWPAGMGLFSIDNGQMAVFRCVGKTWLGGYANGDAARPYPLLMALKDIVAGEMDVKARRTGWSLAVITLSDKGAAGSREDLSGPEIVSQLESAMRISMSRRFLLPDDEQALRGLMGKLALEDRYDLIISTGGTGLGERDITPQATHRIIDIQLPGFVQAMLASSLNHTPNGAISRATAGIAGKSVIINLPGSLKAVKENLTAILPCLPHALDKINGDSRDCGVANESSNR